MRIQFSISAEGRAANGGETAERANTIIECVERAALGLGCALEATDSLVADLPDGISVAYQRHPWRKEEFAVYQVGRKVEVVFRHNGNATITYMSHRNSQA